MMRRLYRLEDRYRPLGAQVHKRFVAINRAIIVFIVACYVLGAFLAFVDPSTVLREEGLGGTTWHHMELSRDYIGVSFAKGPGASTSRMAYRIISDTTGRTIANDTVPVQDTHLEERSYGIMVEVPHDGAYTMRLEVKDGNLSSPYSVMVKEYYLSFDVRVGFFFFAISIWLSFILLDLVLYFNDGPRLRRLMATTPSHMRIDLDGLWPSMILLHVVMTMIAFPGIFLSGIA